MVVIAVDCVLYYSIGVDGEVVVAGLEVELDHITIAQLVLYGDKERMSIIAHTQLSLTCPKNALQVYSHSPYTVV